MADNENKIEELKSISDDEAITEIDFGSFLADGEDNSAIIDGLHSDIKETEKSLDDAIQSLYDNIMNSGHETIVPRTFEDITSNAKAPEETSPLNDMWMSPEEYIDIEIPVVDLENGQNQTAVTKSKDDLFGMIENLKTQTDTDNAFDSILAGIESNSNIAPVSAEFSQASSLASEEVINGISSAENLDDNIAKVLGTESLPSNEPIGDIEAAKNEYLNQAGDNAPLYDAQPLPELKATVGLFPEEIDAIDNLPRKERRKAEKEEKAKAKAEIKAEAREKKAGNSELIRKIVLTVSIITIIVSSAILLNTYVVEPLKFKRSQKEIVDIVSTENAEDATAVVDESYTNETNIEYPQGMLTKYAKLYEINQDLSGWISIPNLDINLPIAQSTNNDYYLHRNIYKKWTDYGVPFFDYRIEDFKTLPKNTVVYGHNMRHDDLIFGLLENYREIKGFQAAPVIECNTIYGDHTWFVYAVFITNSSASQDNGYLFPYNFINISNSKFESYIAEIDKRKFYTTGVDINASDNILTLSTCCYDFDEARLVVVAREKRAGESSSVDTSNATKNTNPKYPQAWYDAMKKQNPYASDARW